MVALVNETTTCPGCGKPVVSYWHVDNTGCVSSKKYDLIADTVWHPKCWDAAVKETFS